MKRHPLLILAAALLLSACKPSHWYADATEWVSGLPYDNKCALAEPLVELTPAKETTGTPTPSPVPQGSLILVPAAEAEGNAPSTTTLSLPAGAQVELLRIIVEHRDNTYTAYAELALPQTTQPVWVCVATSHTAITKLPLLLTPATGKPLKLDLNSALEYTEKKPIRR